ncbi:MAG: hypothetical protein OEM02_16280, partial [Desulfobulbaceae bacterium]|nr:hypothetical protein [Desulfobulbaceae bacterium]
MSRVALNSVAGMAANGIYLVSRLAITPFILIYVPLDQYGLWSVCFIIISYAGLSGFGVNNAYIKYSAQYYSRGEMAKLNGLVNTGLALMIGLCGLIFISLYMSVPYFIGKFGVSPELSKLSTMLIIGSAAAFLLDMGLGAFKAVLEGIQEIALVRLIWLASTLVEVVLIVVLLISGIGVLSLLYALAVRYMLAVACYTVLALKKIPGLAIGLRHINRNASRVLFSFGAKVQLLGVIGIFMTSFDRIVTTAFIGLEATGRFEIGRKFPSLGASVSAAAFDAFLPAASSSGSWLEKEREPTVRERLVKYGGLLLCSVLISLIPVAGYLL